MYYTAQQSAGVENSPESTTDFAGMLAKLSSPERSARNWLAEDEAPATHDEIISLSYEQALKKHARRPAPNHIAERIDSVATLVAETLAERRQQSKNKQIGRASCRERV